jgi:hypothetical protein
MVSKRVCWIRTSMGFHTLDQSDQERINNMDQEHVVSFEGCDTLRTIGVAWFVSYAYHKHYDNKHSAWKNPKFSKLSIQSRSRSYDNSQQHHTRWLHEVLKMQQLDKHRNYCGLNSSQIQAMAAEILIKMYRQG